MGQKFNLFFDSGCGDLVIRKDAADKLMELGKAVKLRNGPIKLNGVGNQETICTYGAFGVQLPLKNNSEAKMSGVCVDEVTLPFPKYSLKIVQKDILGEVKRYKKRLLSKLPRLPAEVGGPVDIMIGKHYLKYFPFEKFRSKSGLTLYDSMFRSVDGTSGIVSGPHPEFSKCERASHFITGNVSYYTETVQKYLKYCEMKSEIPSLGYERSFADPKLIQEFPRKSCIDEGFTSTNLQLSSFYGKNDECEFGDLLVGGSEGDTAEDKDIFLSRCPKCVKAFLEIENTGTDISYRCVECRNCKECKKGSLIEEISIKEEYEQNLINKSVTLNIDENKCIAHLPFLDNPDLRLANNIKSARKVYDKVIRSLAKSAKDREDVIKAENKLQELGFVDWLENLDENDRKLILDAPIQYYIPWRIVWSNSITTPVRPVFDGTMRSPGGCSLNDILPKGTNNMNNLVEMLIRWFSKAFAYHTDISKCYNGVKMDKSSWRFQLYLFDSELNPNKEPKPKVIKTCIYGLRPSGNQAERALRITAETFAEEYPMAQKVVNEDLYVDDCVSGEATESDRDKVTEELQLCLEKGGFSLKGFTFSGLDPDVKLSKDSKSISVGGLKWFPKEDYIQFNLKDINFCRKVRGRKVESMIDLPNKVTLRDCASIVGQIFDPTGKAAPIIAGLKLDLSMLHRIPLKWDDEIPENFREIWSSNLELIKEMSNLRYKRAIVPPEAKNLNIVTIDTGDASSSLACVAIYARFEKKDGSYSCQLVLSRTKVLPEGTSTPRGELIAAAMNAATGHVVKRAFGRYHHKCIKLTDSTVTLYWISSQITALKTWVRSRVIEINRLCEASLWYYVETHNMIADLGTRKGVTVKDVNDHSMWINGLPWMSEKEESFPIWNLEKIKLSQEEILEAKRETMAMKSFYSCHNAMVNNTTDDKIRKYYALSKYLIDPNRFRFRKVIRVLALAFTFIWKISKNVPRIRENLVFRHVPPNKLADVLKFSQDRYILTTGLLNENDKAVCKKGKVVELKEPMLMASMSYFAIKSSKELKQLVKREKFCNISKEVDGILYYSGRILENYEYGGYPELCEAAIDLRSTTFCVPVMNQYSPVAISIALEIHWYHPDVKHTGIEAIHRKMLEVAYIIGGKPLAISIKSGCKKCRILKKKSVEVAMGPIQSVNLCIAPAFYASQIDIFGPFKAYSPANKRATLKVWFLIFCCCTTGGVDIRVLEDYSTDSVILGFVRFSCKYGYPKYALPDAGSQLVKSCEVMNYSFTDTKNRLFNEYGIEYTPCPVGAHYIHGKVERKIREVKKSVRVNVEKERLSYIQWETLMSQISNSINNLPIGIRNKSKELENLDLITPNRLILGRNNERSPNAPLRICPDHKKIIESNAAIFKAWFKAWIISCVPQLIERPKWHISKGVVNVGDIVLFLKSEKEFDEQYQYGKVQAVYEGKDGLVRKVDVLYKNFNENSFRTTQRGVREIVLIFQVDELDIYEQLHDLI